MARDRLPGGRRRLGDIVRRMYASLGYRSLTEVEDDVVWDVVVLEVVDELVVVALVVTGTREVVCAA